MPDLDTPLRFIKRIGPRVAEELARKGILTVEDLLYHLPFRYEDRLHPQPIAALQPGTTASVIAEVRGSIVLRTRRMPLFELTVGQGTSTLKAIWFNGAYLQDRFPLGAHVALFGPIEASRSTAGRLKMLQPQFEILPELLPGPQNPPANPQAAADAALEVDRIVPVYETTGGTTAWGAKLSSRWLRRVLHHLLNDLTPASRLSTEASSRPDAAPRDAARERPASPPPPPNPTLNPPAPQPSPGCHPEQSEGPASPPPIPASIPDPIPAPILRRLNLPTRLDALRDVHFPPPGTPMADLLAASTPAHRRLIFEEFFFLELGLELKRRRLLTRRGTPFRTDQTVREALKQILPFHPTAAQKRVLAEIAADMRRPQPMRRLLQGDVGSGKTIVAMQAALIAIENGLQVALMAPTEILATQHFLAARKLLAHARSPRSGRPYRLALLTGSLDERSKRDTRHRIAAGDVDLAIGTHALFEDTVDIPRLGLAIIDEQHRFGVQQRLRLMRKPTASPSPQTASLPTEPPPATASVISTEAAKESAISTEARQNAVTSTEARQNAVTPTEARQNAVISTEGDPQGRRSGETPVSAPTSLDRSQSQAPPHSTSRMTSAAPNEPDTLVMTATPIPRTLALTLYGDLDVSVLDQLPPGRTPITTRRTSHARIADVWTLVRKQVAAGRQAYVVYPIIEGTPTDQAELDFAPADDPNPSTSTPDATPTQTAADHPPSPPRRRKPKSSASHPAPDPLAAKLIASVQKPRRNPAKSTPTSAKSGPKATPTPPNLFPKTPLRAAADMFDELRHGPLQGLRLGLLHGRLSPAEKDIVMRQFTRGDLDVLIATTVIEVGVDVPNATLVVIDHAERFGLSQLHQLRGRVGRGAQRSYCILVTGDRVSQAAEARLDAMVSTTDGFELAELDLQQRGPGEFFGTRQAGLPELRVASLLRDRATLELARAEAARFAAAPDPTLTPDEIEQVWTHLRSHWQRRYALLEA